MPRLALLLLVLAACSSNETVSSESSNPVPMEGWRTERGGVPTKAEFTAVVASCQDRAKGGSNFDSCLTDLGLRRSHAPARAPHPPLDPLPQCGRGERNAPSPALRERVAREA